MSPEIEVALAGSDRFPVPSLIGQLSAWLKSDLGSSIGTDKSGAGHLGMRTFVGRAG